MGPDIYRICRNTFRSIKCHRMSQFSHTSLLFSSLLRTKKIHSCYSILNSCHHQFHSTIHIIIILVIRYQLIACPNGGVGIRAIDGSIVDSVHTRCWVDWSGGRLRTRWSDNDDRLQGFQIGIMMSRRLISVVEATCDGRGSGKTFSVDEMRAFDERFFLPEFLVQTIDETENDGDENHRQKDRWSEKYHEELSTSRKRRHRNGGGGGWTGLNGIDMGHSFTLLELFGDEPLEGKEIVGWEIAFHILPRMFDHYCSKPSTNPFDWIQ